MSAAIDRPQLNGAARREGRVAGDDRVQPRDIRGKIQGRRGVADGIAGAIVVGPGLDHLHRAEIPRPIGICQIAPRIAESAVGCAVYVEDIHGL